MITNWRKSTRSQPDGSCVEFGNRGRQHGVRDSKNPNAPYLVFTPAARAAFTSAIAAGRLTAPR